VEQLVGEPVMSLEQLSNLATQQRHMDIIEDRLLDTLEQLKIMRQEHEELMTELIKENR
jgi:hypothetical protein